MKRFPNCQLRQVLTVLALGTAIVSPACGDSLDDYINKARPSAPVVTDATVALWDRFLSASESSNLDDTRKLADEFWNAAGATEPYQKDFTDFVRKTYDLKEGRWVPESKADAEKELDKLKKVAQDFEATLSRLGVEREPIAKDVEGTKGANNNAELANIAAGGTRRAPGPGGIGGILGGVFGFGDKANTANAVTQRLLEQKREKLAVLDTIIGTNNTALASTRDAIKRIEEGIRDGDRRHANQFRDDVVSRVTKLSGDGYPRAAFALANHYTRVLGSDARVIEVADLANKNLKRMTKASEIAAIIGKDALDSLTGNKPWAVLEALDEAGRRIQEKVSDDAELGVLVARELGNIKRRAERLIGRYTEERNGIFGRASTNPQVVDDFERWLLAHPDYPGAEKDRTALVEADLKENLQTIQAIVESRPVEAYDKLRELLAKLDTRRRAVVESKLGGLMDQILDGAAAGLKKRLDETTAFKIQVDQLDHAARKDLLSKWVADRAGIQAETEAWLKRPMSDLAKAKFASITKGLGATDVAREPAEARVAGSEIPPAAKTGVVAFAALGALWFFVIRKTKPAATKA